MILEFDKVRLSYEQKKKKTLSKEVNKLKQKLKIDGMTKKQTEINLPINTELNLE